MDKNKIDKIYSSLEKDLTLEILSKYISRKGDKLLYKDLMQGHDLYYFLIPYNLKNNSYKGLYKGMQDVNLNKISSINYALLLEFIRINLARSGDKSKFDYIELINNELEEVISNKKPDYSILMDISKKLDFSIEFVIPLSKYLECSYRSINTDRFNATIKDLELSKEDGFHDFNIFNYFKEDESSFLNMVINNLKHDYGEEKINLILKEKETSGLVLVAGLYDGFLYNLKNKDKRFIPLYKIINDSTGEFLEGRIDKNYFNIILGYVVTGLRYSLSFYTTLTSYMEYLYLK